VKNFEDMFSDVDIIPSCDRQTDRHTSSTAKSALCIRYYRTSVISAAQWMTIRNQMIFAVFDVSLNNGL